MVKPMHLSTCLLLLSLATILPAQTPEDWRTQPEALPFYGPKAVQPKDYKSGQSPQDAVKNMTLPPGFKAEVVVAEPEVVQPIAMCFDERGRLWVAEGNAYPQKRVGDKGPDRILIFEDTKGTGKFDKRTVFIEGLNLVSGLEVGFGGVWVGAAPQLLFIPKDADDKPGVTQVLLDGWGMQDTHETLNSFIWGPDGWLYGCHGVFTYSLIGKPGTPDAQRTPMNAGVWRYHPVRHEFEVFAHGTSNPWGLDYDEHGEFFITACVIPHLYHIVPGGRYQRQGGQHYNPYTYDDIKTIADHAHYAGNIKDNAHWGDHHSSVNLPVANDTNEAGGGHAHCGLCIYQGDNFPPEYRGQLIFGNLHGHRLVHDEVKPNGSSFIGEHRPDFMRSNDHWFIPIQQKLGPDGALYVSDWSDKQVCHQGSSAVDAWDRSNGRIYRISYEGDKAPRSGGFLPPSESNRDSGKKEAQGSAGVPPAVVGVPPDTSGRAESVGVTKSGDASVLRETPKTAGGTPALPNISSAAKRPHAPFDLNKLSDLELAKMAVEDTNEFFVRQARRVYAERYSSHSITPQENSQLKLDFEKQAKTSSLLKVTWLFEPTRTDCSWSDALEQRSQNRGWQKGITDLSKNEYVRSWAWRNAKTPRFGKEGYLPTEIALKHGPNAKAFLEAASTETSPIVRRSMASALQHFEVGEDAKLSVPYQIALAEGLLSHAEDANDPNIPFLIWYGIEPVVGADGVAGMKLAAASKMDKVTGFIYRRLSSDEKGRVALLRAAADMPDAMQREKMLAMTLDSARTSGKLTAPSDWSAIAAKLRSSFVVPPSGGIGTANERPEGRMTNQGALDLILELSALFNDANAAKYFRETLKHPKAEPTARDHALAVLVQTRDLATAKVLQDLIKDRDTPSLLRRKCIQTLVALPDSESAGTLVNAYQNLSADEKTDTVSTLASSLDGASALLQGVTAKKIEPQMLTPFLVRQLQTLNNQDLNTLLAKALGGTVNPAKPDIAQQKAKWQKLLTSAVLKAADPNKGHELFKGTCATCHRLLGEGANVGPDLTGSNRANLDYLLDNVLDPSAVIGKGYELNIFSMKDARVLSGIMKEETPTGYKLALPGGVELVLGKDEVGKRDVLKVSMMPEGQFDALGPEMVANLVAYLQSNANKADAPSVKVEGALEGEALKVIKITGGITKTQSMSGFKNSRWSGGAQLWWTGGKVGDALTLALPVAEKGSYSLKAVLTKAKDYGIVEIRLDGKLLSEGKIDFYNPEVVTSGELDWGLHDLDAGEHLLDVKIIGANPSAASAHLFGLDYLKLEKK